MRPIFWEEEAVYILVTGRLFPSNWGAKKYFGKSVCWGFEKDVSGFSINWAMPCIYLIKREVFVLICKNVLEKGFEWNNLLTKRKNLPNFSCVCMKDYFHTKKVIFPIFFSSSFEYMFFFINQACLLWWEETNASSKQVTWFLSRHGNLTA